MKSKESFNGTPKYGSCLSFILLIVLSSLVTVALSVLYVEIYQLQDDIFPTQPLQHVGVNEQVIMDKKVAEPFEIKKEPDAQQVPKENTTRGEKLPTKKPANGDLEKKENEKLNKVSKPANDIKHEQQDKAVNTEDSVKAEEVMDKTQNIKSQQEESASKKLPNVASKKNEIKNVKSAIKKEPPGNPKPEEIPQEKLQPKANSKLDTTWPKIEEIENQIVVNGDKDELFKLYIEVEALTDDILSTDPQNDMIRQLAPHLETTLRDIELDRLGGIKEGLLHIRSILVDLKERIDLSEAAKKKNKKPSPQTPSSDGKEPVIEVIPDPVYIAPRVDASATGKKDKTVDTQYDKRQEKVKTKEQTITDTSAKLLEELKLESDKNPLEVIKKIDEIPSQNPNKANFLLLKANTLDLLSVREKSNAILEQAIETYYAIIELAAKDIALVPKDTLKTAGMTCAEKMIFRGFHQKAVRLLQQMIKFFPSDVTFTNKLGVAFLTSNELQSAKDIFEQSLKLSPKDGFAQVHYGFILKSKGTNLKDAVTFLQNGIRTGDVGTSDGRFYYHLGDALYRLNETEKARQVYKEGAKKGLFLNEWQRSLYNVDRLTSRPVWTQDQSTYAQFFKKLENNWKKIKLEGLAVMALDKGAGFEPETENLKDTGDWGQFELFTRGKKYARNCARAPITCALIEEFAPAAGCKRGQVKFSLMQPNTHVWPHTGPTNCRLRAHLGLVVPDAVELRIADQTLTWREGRVIVFDDSWEHEVWHRGSSARLILIVDVWHPDLSNSEKRSMSAI